MKEPKQVNYFDYYPKNIPQCEESWGNKETIVSFIKHKLIKILYL
jgi:hypothetical protein